MSEVDAALRALRASELNARVGGGDPAEVGEACWFHFKRQMMIGEESRVLDFGCGAGRTILAMLRERPNQPVVGVDIMAPAIDFCEREIGSRFPNARFELLAESNEHYDGWAGAGTRKTAETLGAEYAGAFDLGWAFSVFTHLEPRDVPRTLSLIARMLKPGAKFYLTYFGLTPHTRARIAAGKTQFGFARPAFEDAGRVFVGDTADRLGFIALEPQMLVEAAYEAGLVATNGEIGAWSEPGIGWSYQDVMVVQKTRDGV